MNDGLANYDLYHAMKREQLVRAGLDMPVNDTERRWASEGPIEDIKQLDVVRDYPVGKKP